VYLLALAIFFALGDSSMARYSANRYNTNRYNVGEVAQQPKYGARKSPSAFFLWQPLIIQEKQEPIEVTHVLPLTEISRLKSLHTLGLTDNSFLHVSDQLEITTVKKLLHGMHELEIPKPIVEIAEIAIFCTDALPSIMQELRRRGLI